MTGTFLLHYSFVMNALPGMEKKPPVIIAAAPASGFYPSMTPRHKTQSSIWNWLDGIFEAIFEFLIRGVCELLWWVVTSIFDGF